VLLGGDDNNVTGVVEGQGAPIASSSSFEIVTGWNWLFSY